MLHFRKKTQLYLLEKVKFFHLKNTFAGDNWPFSHVEINPEPTNTANSELEGCSGGGDDGGESQNSGTGNDSDENKNLNENSFPSLSIKTSKKDNLEGSGDFESRSKTSTEDKETGSRSDVEEAAQDFKLETNGKSSVALVN